MRPILAGIETEYGLEILGRGPEDQIDDSKALVRSYPGKRFSGWDYRFESPRADLRGYQVSKLNFDPDDARFDQGRTHGPDSDIRADQVLTNGARFYNDHGHPEIATPECWGLDELMLQDLAGERIVNQAAEAYTLATGLTVRIYKNNTDFHGASYGCHESYLSPRALGYERLRSAVGPLLVARQLVCGAGKSGSESGSRCEFQLSQRADFMDVDSSVDTLFRRPVFNTRDEPHADVDKWIRLHVIAGDANMAPASTRRRVGLVKLALWLEEAGECPNWRIRNIAQAFRNVSQGIDSGCRIELEGGGWTDAASILDSYCSAAIRVFGLRDGLNSGSPEHDAWSTAAEVLALLGDLSECPDRFAQQVDWAAKRKMLRAFAEGEGIQPGDKRLQAYDLAYHLLDEQDGLYFALEQMGEVAARPESGEIERRIVESLEPTRALARGTAVSKYKDHLQGVSWGCLRFDRETGPIDVPLPPDGTYARELEHVDDIETFIQVLRNPT